MPDYGTKIADFTGRLHDGSQSAFDAIAMRDADHDLRQLTEPVRATFQKYVDKLGLKVDFTEPGAVQKLFKDAATKVAAAYAGKVLASAAAILIGEDIVAASVAGPIGAVIALGIDVAIIAFRSKKDETPEGGYKPGQWVMIDNGLKTVTKKVERAISWGEAAIFGDAPTKWDLELDREEDYSLGFIMGPGPEVHEWTVFNLKTSEEEAVDKFKIRPCDQQTAEQLDNNDETSLIREYKFLAYEEELLAGTVPTKPGSQVLFKGKLYRIVKTEGNAVLIENSAGDQIQTFMINLERGMVDSNIGYNMRDGKRVQQGFSAAPLEGIYRGMWAWVVPSIEQTVADPNIRRSLGVIILLQTNDVKGVYALDGKFFEVGEDQLKPCVVKTVERVLGTKLFREFHERCVADWPSENELQIHAPGKQYPLVCVGIGQEEGRDRPSQGGKPGTFTGKNYRYTRYVGDYGEKAKLAAKEEAIEKGHASAGWEEEQRVFREPDHASSGEWVVLAVVVVAAGYFLFS